MATHTVNINRAPVLTLWAAVVAERLGYDHEAALTLGKAVAGLNAYAKGRRLGMCEELKGLPEEREPKARQLGEPFLVSLLHRRVPVISTERGMRATVKGQPIDPESVRRYLAQKFSLGLADVWAARDSVGQGVHTRPTMRPEPTVSHPRLLCCYRDGMLGKPIVPMKRCKSHFPVLIDTMITSSGAISGS